MQKTVSFRKEEVPILEDENFDTALEFGLTLSEPEHCSLGRYLHKCRVVIVDDDTFPTNRFAKQVSRKPLFFFH